MKTVFIGDAEMRKIYLLENKGFSDFSPCDAGREDCEPGHKFGPRIRNYYLIHFVLSGEGSFTTPRGECKVKSGEAFLIKPGEITVYEADSNAPWEYIWLGFRGNLSDRFAILGDVFEYPRDITDDLEGAFATELGREEALTSVIFKLAALLFSEHAGNDYQNQVKSYIDTHYMENITISDIAQTLSLNRKYLARIFKEKNGISMQEYLINKRLYEAKKLLLQGYTVEESSYMVGYSDQFGFSKAFKKRYGISPVRCKGKG